MSLYSLLFPVTYASFPSVFLFFEITGGVYILEMILYVEEAL